MLLGNPSLGTQFTNFSDYGHETYVSNVQFMFLPFRELAMLGSPILDSSLNGCGGTGAVGGGGDHGDCYSPKLNDSYRGTNLQYHVETLLFQKP